MDFDWDYVVAVFLDLDSSQSSSQALRKLSYTQK